MRTEKLNLVQRTAVGNDQSGQSTIYLIMDEYGLVPTTEDDIRYIDVIVEVTHPYIMAGTWEEIRNDVARIIDDRLTDQGVIVRNKYGLAKLQ